MNNRNHIMPEDISMNSRNHIMPTANVTNAEQTNSTNKANDLQWRGFTDDALNG